MNNVFSRNDYIDAAKNFGHSDEFINELVEYMNNLIGRDLPIIFSTKHLAELIKIPYKDLVHIIDNRYSEYSNFRIRKKKNGYREIMAPSENLKYLQRWIVENILQKVKLHESCKGFRAKVSIKDNAQIHEGKDAILKVDLLRFFDTITEKRVYGMFKKLGYNGNLAVDLSKLCTVAASNLYLNNIKELGGNIEISYKISEQGFNRNVSIDKETLNKIDNDLNDLAKGLGILYSRVGVNILFSAEIDILWNIDKLEDAIEEKAYWLKNSKRVVRTSENETFRVAENLLPQGAPTSPYIANILATQMDRRFASLANKLGISYSRYADDLVFSGELNRLPSINMVEKIISQEGFFINKSKTKIQRRGNRQLVTGLTVTNGVHVPKKYKKDIWYHLHYCKLVGPREHLKYINSNKTNYKDWLYGRICFVYSIEPEVGKKMMNEFNEILWIL